MLTAHIAEGLKPVLITARIVSYFYLVFIIIAVSEERYIFGLILVFVGLLLYSALDAANRYLKHYEKWKKEHNDVCLRITDLESKKDEYKKNGAEKEYNDLFDALVREEGIVKTAIIIWRLIIIIGAVISGIIMAHFLNLTTA